MLEDRVGGDGAGGDSSIVKDKFDKWLSEVMLLRATFVESGAQFFRKVSEGEEHEIWKLRGYTSFERVLEQCNIMKVSRYKDFKMLRDRVGWNAIEKLGVDELMPLLKVPENAIIKVNKEEISKVTSEVDMESGSIKPSMTVTEAVIKTALQSRERRGAPPSRQSIQAYISKFKSVAILPRAPRTTRPARRVDDRDAKISALKKEVADRDKKIVELRRALAEKDQTIKELEKRLALLRGRKR